MGDGGEPRRVPQVVYRFPPIGGPIWPTTGNGCGFCTAAVTAAPWLRICPDPAATAAQTIAAAQAFCGLRPAEDLADLPGWPDTGWCRPDEIPPAAGPTATICLEIPADLKRPAAKTIVFRGEWYKLWAKEAGWRGIAQFAAKALCFWYTGSAPF